MKSDKTIPFMTPNVTIVKDGKRCVVLFRVYICIIARCIKQHN